MKLIEEVKSKKWKICSYGLGVWGTGTGRKLLEWLNIEPDYYCDRDLEVLEKYPVEKEKKISISDLLQVKEEMLVFIFLGTEYIRSAQQELQKNSYLHILSWQQLIREDELIKKYFGIGELTHHQKKDDQKYCQVGRKLKSTDRIAIYTCITNNYDQLNEPLFIEENCDYYFITDREGKHLVNESSVYKVVDIEDVTPNGLSSPKDKNRYCKSHGYEIFKDYQYSIYLDGNIQIVQPIVSLLELMGEVGVAFHKHPYAEDVYEEAMSLSLRERITKVEADKTMKWFWNSGMPRFYGMVECGVILCDNHNFTAKELLDKWFDNYNNGAAKRDQIYMAYSLWEIGIPINAVRVLPGNWRTNGYFRIMSKHSGYQK